MRNESSLSHAGNNRWGIVLAGGQGSRMQTFIRSWLGEHRPKQYCTFVGTRAMIDHTVDRALSFIPPNQIITVIADGHLPFVPDSVHAAGKVIEQPRDAGAAAGVFLPLTHILAQDPDATVVLLPSDHFVFPEKRFCDLLVRACHLAETYPERVVLLAAKPDRPETDYGWISRHPEDASAKHDDPIRVSAFHEKPNADKALELMEMDGLWSTMVTVAKARTLWEIGMEFLPKLTDRFDQLRKTLQRIEAGAVPAAYEGVVLANVYRNIPRADFSRDLLERIPDRTLVLPMHGIHWCDWGRPHRVADTLRHIGKQPAFPPHHMTRQGNETDRYALQLG